MANRYAGLAACCLICCCSASLNAQIAKNIQDVKSVFLDGFGDKPGAAALRKEVAAQLEKSHQFRLSATASEADAVLRGSGEVWVKGHYSLNPRERLVNGDAQTVYGGFLSVELLGKADETLWSYLATPHSATSGDINRDLAKLIVKKLAEARDSGAKTP